MTTPICIFSDSPAGPSGLGRITRDLALRIHKHLPDFRVCTLGHGSPGSSRLPFPQYHWRERDDFIPSELPFIAEDFANNEPMILFTIQDIQRMLQVADSSLCLDKPFAQWMSERRRTGRLKLWGYFPIDAHGIGGKLPAQLAHTLTHYDRVLVPSQWAAQIVAKTLPNLKVDVIPHGIDTDVFKPYPKEESQDLFSELLSPIAKWPTEVLDVDGDALWIGIVATNQSRKDFGLGIEVVAEIAKTRPVFLWIHTDRMKHEWSILELLSEFGLLRNAMVTIGNVKDEVMARAYNACDLTLGVGRGEGFGYPIMESWSCGVPCIAGRYGAHVEFIPEDCAVEPSQLRIEGPLNLMRPVFGIQDWVDAVSRVEGNGMVLNTAVDWKYLWQDFEQWFKEGING